MKILVMGGTRFVGKSLVSKLLNQNHDIDIFTRGNKSNPDNRCTVDIPKDVDTVTLTRPNLYRLHGNIGTINIASERVFIDANNFHIQLLNAETDENSYIDTADRIVKILVADAKITVLKFKNVSTIYLVDCKVLTPLIEDVKGLVRIDS